ncbi:upper zone of growth plate and cartilage matrix associated a [Clupea harengus]|uniref:Unique cartilage matrix-associated protein n=1 Tax=Clupea harengus TaxID=7950 RepID=A0A6P3VS43_CLUHA|nr:upper zone of growth plate and cartilage matrix associated a [Clupea harengus]
MAWTRVLLLSLLAGVLLLSLFRETQGAAVRDDKDAKSKESPGRVFMEASDASHFLKRRSRRSPKSYAEMMAEYRVIRATSERRRENQEEQRTEFENYAEEERDEQRERTQEKNEQYREYYYDGMYPRYPHHRHPH